MKITRTQLRRVIRESLGDYETLDDSAKHEVIDRLIRLMIFDIEYGIMIAEDYGVSREAILRRVKERYLATGDIYLEDLLGELS